MTTSYIKILEIKQLQEDTVSLLKYAQSKLTFLHIKAPDTRYRTVHVTHGEEYVREGQWPESDKAKEASSEGP